ncbi:o-succinylbenzoate--CoA ligase [soil metagenome]
MSSLRPVSGPATELLAELRWWNEQASEPEPLVVDTSGSSGEPKPVLLSRRALRASAAATSTRLGGPGQWLLMLAPTYVAGLLVLFRSVVAETDLVLGEDHPDLHAATAAMTEKRRYLSLVPIQLRRLLDEPASVEGLRTFSTVLVGGAHLPKALRHRAADAGVHVVATYGMSETCGGCVYDGAPLDGVGLDIRADGRLLLGGPVLFDGYDGRPELTEEVLRDGWFLTQDLARLGEDGSLEVLGRADDVVVSGGVKVPTPAVAARLQEHLSVSAVSVVGAPDAEWGQRVVAFIVGDLRLGAARDWVSEALPRSWAPREIRRVDELPLLENGKVDRVRLREVAGG